jgi:large subunit ribosomal protein L32e
MIKMNNIKELLEKRKQVKKTKPSFFRKDRYKKSRIGKSWRKPRGLDNKQRLGKRGPAIKISNGYRAPKAVRGMHKSGLLPMVVCSAAQLSSLTKEHGVIVSANVGDRKRLQIITEAQKKGLTILNLDADETLTRIQSDMKERKEMKTKQLEEEKDKKKGIDEKVKKEEQRKEAKKAESPETAEAVKKEEAELSEDEKKKQEKEEKDKLLTKRG